MTTRPKHVSTRPGDEPIFTNPVNMDFEKRRLIVPPSFIELAVLAGGDEYVKAEDIATIVNAVIENLGPVLQRIETHLALGSGEELNKEDIE